MTVSPAQPLRFTIKNDNLDKTCGHTVAYSEPQEGRAVQPAHRTRAPPGRSRPGARASVLSPAWVCFPNVSSTYSCWSQRSTGEDGQRRGAEDRQPRPPGGRMCPLPWPATAHHKPFVWSPWPFFFWDRPVLLVLDQEKNTPFRFRSLSSSRSSFRDRPDRDFPVSCRQVENVEKTMCVASTRMARTRQLRSSSEGMRAALQATQARPETAAGPQRTPRPASARRVRGGALHSPRAKEPHVAQLPSRRAAPTRDTAADTSMTGGTFFGVDTLEWSELTLCLEAGLLGTCCESGRERPSTSARMHSWYSGDFRKRV